MTTEIRNLFAYREMLKTTVRREIRSRYKGSVLGFLWNFLNPLLQLMVFSFVFRFVVRLEIPGYSYTVFLFVGLVAWTAFGTTLTQAPTVYVANANLIKKIYFPRVLLPVATVASNIVNMLLSLIIVFGVLWITGSGPTIYYAYLPFVLLTQATLMLGFALVLSTLNVYFRDLEHIVAILAMAWFYLSPVLYTPDLVGSVLFHVYKLNPMFPIITAYQDVLLFGRAPDVVGLVYSLVFGTGATVVGYLVFDALQRRFAEEL